MRLLLLVTAVLWSPWALAHHAKEYLRTESYAQAPRWGVAVFNGFDHYRPSFDRSEGEEWEYTPTVALGLHERLMLDVHTHLLHIEGHDPFFEAMALGLQGQITAPGESLVDVALGVEYEVPFGRSRELIDGRQLVTTTLIVSRELPHDINATVNLFYAQEIRHGDDSELGYAAAVKGHVIPPLDWLEAGVELVGTFQSEPQLAVVPGVYLSPWDFVVLKAGSSFGLTPSTADLGVHVVLAFNFALVKGES